MNEVEAIEYLQRQFDRLPFYYKKHKFPKTKVTVKYLKKTSDGGALILFKEKFIRELRKRDDK